MAPSVFYFVISTKVSVRIVSYFGVVGKANEVEKSIPLKKGGDLSTALRSGRDDKKGNTQPILFFTAVFLAKTPSLWRGF